MTAVDGAFRPLHGLDLDETFVNRAPPELVELYASRWAAKQDIWTGADRDPQRPKPVRPASPEAIAAKEAFLRCFLTNQEDANDEDGD